LANLGLYFLDDFELKVAPVKTLIFFLSGLTALSARADTVYTNETDFVGALGSSASFLNDFNDLTRLEQYVHPLQYASNGLAYRITSSPELQILSLPGSVCATGTNVVIVTSFTSTNVRAVGGGCFLTDTNRVAADGSVWVSLNGGAAVGIASSTNGPGFWGCVSGGDLFTNLAIQSDTAGGYPTLDHFYAAEGEPVLVAPEVTAGARVLSWPAPATGYVLQSSTNLASWTPVGLSPQTTNHQMQVQVPESGPATFYRLVK